MQDARVVITGLGTINAVARNVPLFHTALRQGQCGIGTVSVFDTSTFRTQT
ncbi:MAG: hypothetical protein JJV98_10275 [Desulfosarcina sp.]|nr:hypothetical protein [Desulfobacterales bacterium]